MSLLVRAQWLEPRLEDHGLRVFDCTVEMQFQPIGKSRLISGRADWARAHLPGAGFLAMESDFSHPQSGVGLEIPYGLPEPARVENLLQEAGVNTEDTIVLYGRGYQGPVVRMWWVLTAMGAKDVRILDGGLDGWIREGRALSDAPLPPRPRGDFKATPRPALRAEVKDVRAALADEGTALINALSPEQFAGTGGAHYGRPGRIPESLSLPFRALLRDGGPFFKSEDEIRELIRATGALDRPRIISYCGGGIAAAGTTFALHLIGRTDAALYDGSLTDWCADPARPLVTDTSP